MKKASEKSVLEKFDSPFASKLRHLMSNNMFKREITQIELANKIGVTRQVISQYANGNTIPNIDKLVLIADFFKVSADYLLGLSQGFSTDDELKFVCKYTGLIEKAIQFLNMIKQNADLENKGNINLKYSTYRLEILNDFFINEKFDKLMLEMFKHYELSDRLIEINRKSLENITELEKVFYNTYGELKGLKKEDMGYYQEIVDVQELSLFKSQKIFVEILENRYKCAYKKLEGEYNSIIKGDK